MSSGVDSYSGKQICIHQLGSENLEFWVPALGRKLTGLMTSSEDLGPSVFRTGIDKIMFVPFTLKVDPFFVV